MATPTSPQSTGSIGASRLIGTNGLQSAVDSLSAQVNKLTTAVSGMFNSYNKSNGTGSTSSSTWNAQSNRSNYSSGNGGGGSFSGGGTFGSNGRGNGGGGSFGVGSRVSGKLGFTLAAGSAVAAAATNYGNKNMSNMM